MLARRTSDLDSPPPKPMRKGTHSCLECRQRKVRCIVEPHARKCNACSAKDLRCTDQELRRSRSPDLGERKSTRDRVRELEGMLDQVLHNQSRVDEVVSSHKPFSAVPEPFERLPAAEERVPATEVEIVSTKKPSKADLLDPNFPEVRLTRSQDFGDEPLLGLFKDVDVGERRDRHRQRSVRDAQVGLPVVDESAARNLQALRVQIPNTRELMLILRAGQSALNIWSGAFPDELGIAGNGFLERLRDHIYRSLHSDSMADAAKVVHCLALHIQQLPTDFDTTKIGLLAPLSDLQETYMIAAESLLASDEGPAGTVDGLECMILQSDYYINLGNLRKVWLIVRRALSLAQLLGLQRKIDAEQRPKLALRQTAIWSELWQRDRGFSLILGLPYATLESQVPQLTSNNDDSDLQSTERFLRDLGIAMGHIIRRDQDPKGTTYSITLQIEEELEECQSIMSAKWWDFTPSPDTPTDVLCGMFVAKMRFHTVQRLLHLPFLLKAFKNEKYQSSRLATLQSSREMINVYNVLRDEKRPLLKTCEMIDFQVFAAAMTLVVNLLACSQPPAHRDLHREERDWQLVLQTAGELRRFSQSTKGCKVAALGARVLNDFSSLQKASAEEICKVDIPYFGRVEIQRRHARHNEHVPDAHAVTHTIDQTQIQHDSVGGLGASVEPAVSTDSYLFPMSAASQPWPVADESWLHMLDSSMPDDWMPNSSMPDDGHMLDSSMADDWSWFPCGDSN